MQATPEELEELKEGFEYNDRDHDGRIDLAEFTAMLEDLEAGIEPEEARLGFNTIDTDRDGAIDLEEFIDWWREQ